VRSVISGGCGGRAPAGPVAGPGGRRGRARRARRRPRGGRGGEATRGGTGREWAGGRQRAWARGLAGAGTAWGPGTAPRRRGAARARPLGRLAGWWWCWGRQRGQRSSGVQTAWCVSVARAKNPGRPGLCLKPGRRPSGCMQRAPGWASVPSLLHAPYVPGRSAAARPHARHTRAFRHPSSAAARAGAGGSAFDRAAHLPRRSTWGVKRKKWKKRGARVSRGC
jgi:hypothetical protein